jgi:5'-nucleotidase
MLFRRLRVVFVAALLAVSCATTPPPASQPVHIVVVGTTDLHGWFAGRDVEGVHYGGVAILKSYIDALRDANGGRVVVVDSGDLFQGKLESNLFEGEPVIRAYNAIGYSASAVGNHEFDFGPVGPDSVAQTPDQDPLGALKRNVSLATFPFVATNVVDKATHDAPAWAKKSIIVEVGGVKLGIIGLSKPDTPSTTTASNVASLDFLQPLQPAIEEAAKLRARGADAVIAIAHMGGKCKETGNPDDTSQCEPDQEIMRVVGASPKGTVDAFFGGHTHYNVRNVINGTPTVEAYNFGQYFATIDFWVDPRAHHVVRTAIRPHTMLCTSVYSGTEECNPQLAPEGAVLVPRVFEGKTITADPELAAIVQPYLDRTAAKRNEPTGIIAAYEIRRDDDYESALGNLITDVLREWGHADVGVMNSGGIRANLPAGPLKYGDVFEVSPFDNYCAVVTMTGAQLAQVLHDISAGGQLPLQVSGIRYTRDDKTRTVVSSTIDPNATYRVAMPDFLAQGGDGFLNVMSTIPPAQIRVDRNRTMRDVMIDILSKHPQPITAKVEGRVTILNGPERRPASEP